VVVTPTDRDRLPEANCPVRVIPCGVDADYFAPWPGPEEGPSVLFRGILSFPPNVDAARYFYREIFPAIRRAVPGTRLILAGRNPAPLVRRLAATDPGVTLTGLLPDVRPAMAKANVHVCPMRLGSGLKTKVLEAMAMGKAVVTTSLGLSGIAAVPGRDFLVADDPDTFAEAVVRLLRDSCLRRRIGSAARTFVVREHNWAAVSERYEETYRAACGAHAGNGG
jgi:glycosyltransferase involved in cell wall biosynthesis